MKHVFSVAAALAVLMASSSVAQADCLPWGEMKASLTDRYNEKPVGHPDAQNTQLWISDRTGSWTLVRYYPDGSACATARGLNWYTELQGHSLLAALRS